VLFPVTLESLITEPFDTVIKLSDYIVNWDILYAQKNETENRYIINMVGEIEDKLLYLKDSDDGAQDEAGNYIFIADKTANPGKGFNCSGFVKWISDGIFSGKTKKLMNIDTLKKKNLSERRNTLGLIYEDIRDPFFGLDWTRNIAMMLYELDHPGKTASIGDVDVKDFPYETYLPDIGYTVKNLKPLLYYLAVTDPGYIYLGSINGDFGKDPVLRQHYHVAAFLPYVDANGNFFPFVFERNKKTQIDDFLKKYSREYIHLVKIKADASFNLPPVSR
jgi:hypothetical protein